jgi:hypothetical protein
VLFSGPCDVLLTAKYLERDIGYSFCKSFYRFCHVCVLQGSIFSGAFDFMCDLLSADRLRIRERLPCRAETATWDAGILRRLNKTGFVDYM